MPSSPWKRASSAAWGFFAPRHVPGTITPNLISAAISTATMLVCCLVFSPQLGMISMLGAMTPFWETGRPLWARVRNSLLVSAALVVSMSVGVLVAPYRWAIVPFSVLVVLVVGILYQAFILVRGPSPILPIYAAVLGTFFGAEPATGWSMVRVTAFAALLASALLLLPLARRPHAPEQRMVAAARRAVSTYEEHSGPGHDRRLARDAAYRAVNDAWLTLESAWPATHNRTHRALAQETADLDRRLAGSQCQGPHVDRHLEHGVEPAAPTYHHGAPLLSGRPSWRYLVSHALRPDSVEWFTTWRMGLAAGVAGLVSEALDIGHPYWAILTASIVINFWIGRVAATRRAAHRTVGTILGIGVVWVVSLAHLSPWWTTVAVMVGVVGQYVLIPLNYALALIFVTPMALLSVAASGAGDSTAGLVADRFVDTLVGALAAVAVTWATSRAFPRRVVRAQSARSLVATRAMERAVEDADPFTGAGLRARTVLQYELTHHMSVLERAVADDPRLADLAPAEHEIADRGFAALARTWEGRQTGAISSHSVATVS